MCSWERLAEDWPALLSLLNRWLRDRRYRLTEAGHAAANLIAPESEPPSDADKVLAALSDKAFVSDQTLRRQTRLPATVIDRELAALLSARRVHRRVDQRGFWYRRAA